MASNDRARFARQWATVGIWESSVVSDYIRDELSAGRLVELAEKEAAEWNVHCSPIGIIPKKTSLGNGN